MARILIVVGHPRSGTLCEALGQSYLRGARAAGHDAELCLLNHLSFDPILHEGFTKVQLLEPDLQQAHDLMLAADHLVIIFPLWLGGMPALLKGFLERILQPDLIEPSRKGKWVKLLRDKSARIITTMGMPGMVYRIIFRSHAVKMLKRNILNFMGVAPVRCTIYGGVEGRNAISRRERWLKEVEALGRLGR